MMLFNPLFLQNENGNENLFIAKRGSLKKKGYLFADIMQVHFNDSVKKNTSNSKFSVSTAENKADNSVLKKGEPASLLTSKKVSANTDNGATTAIKENEQADNSPAVKVSREKLKKIFSQLLGNGGQAEDKDVQILIKSLLKQLSNKGEIVLSVEQNGEKVVVDVSKELLNGEVKLEKPCKTIEGSDKLNSDSQSYAIKIIAIPKNLNLSNLIQNINSTVSGGIDVSEVQKINIASPGGKGERIITVYSIGAEQNASTSQGKNNPGSEGNKTLLNTTSQKSDSTNIIKPVLATKTEGSKVVPGITLPVNKQGEGDKTKLKLNNNSVKGSFSNASNSAPDNTSNQSGNTLNLKESSDPTVKTIVQTTTGKDIAASVDQQKVTETKTSEVIKNPVQNTQSQIKVGTASPAGKQTLGELAKSSVSDAKNNLESKDKTMSPVIIDGKQKGKLGNIEAKINQTQKTEIPLHNGANRGIAPPNMDLAKANDVKINHGTLSANQVAESAVVINTTKNKVSEDKKDVNGNKTTDGNFSKIKTENTTVQSKENNQQGQNFENESNSKNSFSNSANDKTIHVNAPNVQSSNIPAKPMQEFSNIFGKPERIIQAADIVKEFSQFIKKKDNTHLVLQLDPAKLGKVKITLDVAKEIIKAHIEVETNAAKQTVQNNLQELYSQLNKTGINLGSVNITLHDAGNKETKQFSDKRRNSNSFNSKGDFIEEEEKAAVREMGYNTYEYLA